MFLPFLVSLDESIFFYGIVSIWVRVEIIKQVY